MRRIPELDAVRGVAAVAIVLLHWGVPVLAFGTAVDLFFVLSGYLITTILLETRGAPHAFRAFYARRALRIFPIYYFTFPAFLAMSRLYPRPQPLDGLPYFLTYTQNVQFYWGGALPPCAVWFGHTWTLAIEEQFYLFWPLAVWALGAKGLRVAAPVMLAVPAALRFGGLIPYVLLSRCDGLLLGALLAAILADREQPARSRLGPVFAALAVAAAALLAVVPDGRFGSSTGLTLVNLAYAGLVGSVVVYSGRPALRPLRSPWLTGVGRMSYGLYLYHPFTFALVELIQYRSGVHGHAVTNLAKLPVTLGVAWLSWRFLERPLLALKDRFPYGTDRPRSVSSVPAPHFAGARANAERRVTDGR
jgi:peptidoglycan/LPS O-acetylase OafA/YrhL